MIYIKYEVTFQYSAGSSMTDDILRAPFAFVMASTSMSSIAWKDSLWDYLLEMEVTQ